MSEVQKVVPHPVTPKPQTTSEPTPTVSLKDLLIKQAPQSTLRPASVDLKIARPESVNALRDTITSALQKSQPTTPKLVQVTDTVEEVKTVVEVRKPTEPDQKTSPTQTSTAPLIPHEELNKIFE